MIYTHQISEQINSTIKDQNCLFISQNRVLCNQYPTGTFGISYVIELRSQDVALHALQGTWPDLKVEKSKAESRTTRSFYKTTPRKFVDSVMGDPNTLQGYQIISLVPKALFPMF